MRCCEVASGAIIVIRMPADAALLRVGVAGHNAVGRFALMRAAVADFKSIVAQHQHDVNCGVRTAVPPDMMLLAGSPAVRMEREQAVPASHDGVVKHPPVVELSLDIVNCDVQSETVALPLNMTPCQRLKGLGPVTISPHLFVSNLQRMIDMELPLIWDDPLQSLVRYPESAVNGALAP